MMINISLYAPSIQNSAVQIRSSPTCYQKATTVYNITSISCFKYVSHTFLKVFKSGANQLIHYRIRKVNLNKTNLFIMGVLYHYRGGREWAVNIQQQGQEPTLQQEINHLRSLIAPRSIPIVPTSLKTDVSTKYHELSHYIRMSHFWHGTNKKI
jgi:hypothetical protein